MSHDGLKSKNDKVLVPLDRSVSHGAINLIQLSAVEFFVVSYQVASESFSKPFFPNPRRFCSDEQKFPSR